MPRFSAAYLARTRAGMWEANDRQALGALDLEQAATVLDVGSGTGVLAGVLAEESLGRVYAIDRARGLLRDTPASVTPIEGEATALPCASDCVDMVTCQALLVNLPHPATAISEFVRVTRDGGQVAAIEPDNGDVDVSSSVTGESSLAAETRELYLSGARTDVTLGASEGAFASAGLTDISVRRYDHRRIIEPPYSDADVRATARKASGAGLRARQGVLRAGGVEPAEIDRLRTAWRQLGREAIAQLEAGTYRRVEQVPFYVTVGRVSA